MANSTTNLALIKSGYVRSDYPTTVFRTSPSGEYEVNEGGVLDVTKRLYYGFEQISSSIKNRRLYDFRLYVCGKGGSISFIPCVSDFDPATLTWENAPRESVEFMFKWWTARFPNDSFSDAWVTRDYGNFSKDKSLAALNAILHGMQTDSSNRFLKTSLSGGGTPYLEVTYDSSINVKSNITLRSGPSSGYLNPRNAKTFTWAFERDATETYYCAGDFTQQSAALKWKVSGADSWNTVNASGSTTSLTVPANTFPTASNIEWYLTGTDTAGTTSETAHYTFSTTAGTVSVIPTSPINSVEDGSQITYFYWNFSSTDGQGPAYIDFQLMFPEDADWRSIWSHRAAVDHAQASANYFPAGEIKWRVRAYNIDDVAGPWCEYNGNPPSFICVAAPAAPVGIDATEVPRTIITWQATGQEAYEIEIDGRIVQKAFDPSASSWQLEEPLEDGTHTIRVRVQGVYGLWSAWSSVIIDVLNVPPSTATLTGSFRTDALLTFNSEDDPSELVIQWYRDGKRIGRTVGVIGFADRIVLGEHSYFAELWFDSGYYVRTNTITGKMCVRETKIALTDYGSEWLILKLSESSNSMQNFTWSRESSLRHMRGAVYPVLELGEEEDLIGSYECAFQNAQEARKLEALKGRTVIIKSRGGQVLIGALTKLQKRVKDFYITCSFSIQQIHWEDFVNNDQNS